jgi:hypothetical protein
MRALVAEPPYTETVGADTQGRIRNHAHNESVAPMGDRSRPPTSTQPDA